MCVSVSGTFMHILKSLFAVLRWYTQQIYVYKTIRPEEGYQVNKSGGTTISIRKRGGWEFGWADAQKLAGWAKVNV